VGVHVDESWCEVGSINVDDPAGVHRFVGDLLDAPIGNPYVSGVRRAAAAIEDPRVPERERTASCRGFVVG
jgi:hypothetical protein